MNEQINITITLFSCFIQLESNNEKYRYQENYEVHLQYFKLIFLLTTYRKCQIFCDSNFVKIFRVGSGL